jgi:hypothetical protein
MFIVCESMKKILILLRRIFMKFNKIAACLVATACSASVFGAMTSVSAADTLTVKAGSANAKAGETFTIDIELAGVPSSGVAGLDFAIKYDSSVFEITSVTEGAISKTSDKQVEGFSSNLATNITKSEVSVLWATGQISTNSSWIKSDGVLLTLNCKAVSNGTSKVEIVKGVGPDATSVDAVVEGLKIVNPSTAAGTVTVGETVVEPQGVTGDIDLNGVVDLSDLSMLAVSLMDSSQALTGQGLKNADVNSSGKVDLSDLARLRQFLSHKIDKF